MGQGKMVRWFWELMGWGGAVCTLRVGSLALRAGCTMAGKSEPLGTLVTSSAKGDEATNQTRGWNATDDLVPVLQAGSSNLV